MMKRFIPILLSVLLLSVTVHAAADLPEGVSVTVTDITDWQANIDNQLPQHLPTDIQTKTEDGVALLLKTFEVEPDVSPEALIESGLVQNGVEYELRNITRTNAPDGQKKKIVSQVKSVVSYSGAYAGSFTLSKSALFSF